MSDEDLTPVERLARFTLTHQHGGPVAASNAMSSLSMLLYEHVADEESDREQRSLGLPVRSEVTSADALAGLALVREERESLDFRERLFIEAYMDRGGTWPAGAEGLGYPSGGALRSRYRRLGGRRTWPAGRPSTGLIERLHELEEEKEDERVERRVEDLPFTGDRDTDLRIAHDHGCPLKAMAGPLVRPVTGGKFEDVDGRRYEASEVQAERLVQW